MIRGTSRAAVSVCVVAACWCWWTQPAAGQLAKLEWYVPRGCPDASFVEQRLSALSQTETPRRDLTVRGRIQRNGKSHYLLRLDLRASDYHAERRLESLTCASAVDAAIWLIAMALEPSLGAGTNSPPALPTDSSSLPNTTPPPSVSVMPPESPQETTRAAAADPPLGPGPSSVSPAPSADSAHPSAATGAATSPAPSSSASHTPTAATTSVALAEPAGARFAPPLAHRTPSRRDWASLPRWWRAGLFGGVWSAGLPAPQASIGGRIGFGVSALYAELRGAAELSRRRRLMDGTEARLATQDAGLALCSQWGNRLRVGPCFTAAVLRTAGGARQAPEAYDRALLWGALGLSLELGYRLLGGLEIMLETGAQLPVSARPRFTVEGVGEVAVAAPINVYARLGFGFRSTDLAREQ